MGGFAGGDEAGFWEEESVSFSQNKSLSAKKTEPLLSIDNYIYSVELLKNESKSILIEGFEGASFNPQSFFKAYKLLLEYTNDLDIEEFFQEHKVLLRKSQTKESSKPVPLPHSLLFFHLIKDACNLVLSAKEIAELEKKLS